MEEFFRSFDDGKGGGKGLELQLQHMDRKTCENVR